jgi:hypothetical protein
VVYKNDFDMYELLIKLDEEGHYVGTVDYEGVRIGPPHFTIISLSGEGKFNLGMLDALTRGGGSSVNQ